MRDAAIDAAFHFHILKGKIMATVRKASAVWSGNLRDGKGTVSTESGALNGLPYSFHTRFGDERGTNPEELIGAAHAGCFSMALANIMAEAGVTATKIETTSHITLDTVDGAPTVTKAHLVTKISADGDKAKILDCADKAKAGCPISRLLAAAEITMEATVA
jgi:osmotically inducible protein OsmC